MNNKPGPWLSAGMLTWELRMCGIQWGNRPQSKRRLEHGTVGELFWMSNVKGRSHDLKRRRNHIRIHRSTDHPRRTPIHESRQSSITKKWIRKTKKMEEEGARGKGRRRKTRRGERRGKDEGRKRERRRKKRTRRTRGG